MRFFVFTAVALGWMVMWWWVYLHHIKACDTEYGSVATPRIEYSEEVPLPLSFKWSEPTPILSPNFEKWRDSVSLALKKDQVLQVTGLVYRDESPLGDTNLGAQRAKAIIHLLSSTISSEKLIEHNDVGVITGDFHHQPFSGFELRSLTQNDVIRESSTCTLIFFPKDTSRYMVREPIDAYIGQLQEYLTHTNASLYLNTLQNVSDPETMKEDSVDWRLKMLYSQMVARGMPVEKIILEGEASVSDDCSHKRIKKDRDDWIVILFEK